MPPPIMEAYDAVPDAVGPVMEQTGYLHPAYAESLAEFGTPQTLPRSVGRILKRTIAGTPMSDGMGCYPIFACPNWNGLVSDLAALKELVCLSIVTDPFGDYDEVRLRDCFPDLMLPFKRHFVVDLTAAPGTFIAAHHQRNARKALQVVSVEKCGDPREHADEWVGLYGQLIARHGIRGISAFSGRALRGQLGIPGLVAFRAVAGGKTAGMILWMSHNGVAYYHLGAYSGEGYANRASFALFGLAIEHFAANGTRWLSLGAGAGLGDDGDDGLTRFKRGWSTGTRQVYLCGRIFDRAAYSDLTSRVDPGANYFPAYRRGEFG